MTPKGWQPLFALWLTVFAVVLLYIVQAANAQNYPEPRGAVDEWTLERIGPDHFRVFFFNASPPRSASSPEFLQIGDMRVGLHIAIGSGPETMAVFPPPGWVAVPPLIDVIDGHTGYIDLYPLTEFQGT